jgi:hypothetical protein
MIDLTGAHLTAYILRIVRDIVAKNPRFRSSLGEVTFASNNQIQWKNVQVLVKDVSTDGTRLSPDYFMCTKHGRAIVAKVEGKEGSFIEWATETDAARILPEAGVYYLNVDSTNDTPENAHKDLDPRELTLTVHKYKWHEGNLTNAVGTVVYLAPGVDGTTLTAEDASTGKSLTISAFANFLYILEPCVQLVLRTANNVPLAPLTDYWYQRKQDFELIHSTAGGFELANIPVTFVSVTFTDQSGYELRQGIDYNWQGATWIGLSQWTPPKSTITAHAIVKVNPYTTIATHPENIFNVGLLAGESLAPGQAFFHTNAGDFPDLKPDADGNVTLPTLLEPGQWARWEVRIDAGQYQTSAMKYQINTGIIPGLQIAIGDNVVAGDQAAIIVSPTLTETYQVFGSKENLNFTLEVKSNDLQTSSDLSEMIKQHVLVMRRQNMEADGVTIFEVRRSHQGQQRDNSGTAAQYTYTVSVSAACDWKVYLPLVTRVTKFEIIDSFYLPDFQGKLQMAPIMQALGAFQFIQAYA